MVIYCPWIDSLYLSDETHCEDIGCNFFHHLCKIMKICVLSNYFNFKVVKVFDIIRTKSIANYFFAHNL